MKQKTFALYRSCIGCLLLSGLVACVSISPHQQISEAKQALSSAAVLAQSGKLNQQDKLLLQSAYDKLQQAEFALQNQRDNDATLLSEESKRLSQRVLRQYPIRQQPAPSSNPPSNIKFRY